MLVDKMIKVEGTEPLQKVFAHLSGGSGKILLWQGIHESGQRLCQYARIAQLSVPGDEMTLYPLKGTFGFRHHSFIYFFGLKRTTIFKASILYHSPLKLVIRLPKLLMMANSRIQERREFSTGEKLLHYTHCGQDSGNVSPLYNHSYLIDASANGLSFRSSVNNVVRFKKGDRLWMKSPFIQDGLLEGEVKYTSHVKNLGQEDYLRVGVKF